MKEFLGKELLATLKGKSRFYIKTLDKPSNSQIKAVLNQGFEL